MRKYILAATIAVATLSGCASERDTRTVAGAGIGAVLGNVITGGSTAGTVGGAVVGGVIGNQSGNNHNNYDRRSEAQRRYDACRNRGYSDYQCR